LLTRGTRIDLHADGIAGNAQAIDDLDDATHFADRLTHIVRCFGEQGGIIAEQRPAFREYVVSQSVPPFTIPDRVVVGAVLPEAGVTYYDVPQRFGSTPFRYTVVNGETVLVEPRSRRIVQVID